MPNAPSSRFGYFKCYYLFSILERFEMCCKKQTYFLTIQGLEGSEFSKVHFVYINCLIK